ncbi:MAG: glycosyltransferase family 9 protein [Chlamydiae bacterium]|nr:glycosyltransferase family 9 protein [Chlamydiota bacterium]
MDSILIVKTSAIGDVVQTFGALEYLRTRFPNARIDWVVEKGSASLLLAHPLLDGVKIIDSKKWRKNFFGKSERGEIRLFLEDLRKVSYDVVFDFQGNTKSGIVDFFSISKHKVGFGKAPMHEWLNLFFTDHKIEVDPAQSVYEAYLKLAQDYLQDTSVFQPKGVRLKISELEQKRLTSIVDARPCKEKHWLMVALGSNWENKRLSECQVEEFLSSIQQENSFAFVYSTEEEKHLAERLAEKFPANSMAIGDMSLPFWQALMTEMDGVISMDSAALHLAQSAGTPTFSLFGPSSSKVYKPLGSMHVAIQGSCPYGRDFARRCKILRTCKTGACIKDLPVNLIVEEFTRWSEHL